MAQSGVDSGRESFRDYAAEARSCVRELYRENHARQTLAFVREKRDEYLPLRRARGRIPFGHR